MPVGQPSAGGINPMSVPPDELDEDIGNALRDRRSSPVPQAAREPFFVRNRNRSSPGAPRKKLTLDQVYMLVGLTLATYIAPIVFVGCWVYSVAAYGFLFGLGLGWLPSGIVAVVAALALRYLWGLIALAAGWLVLSMLR